jgi:hypothetical protein
VHIGNIRTDLNRRNTLNETLLNERLEASVDNRLMQVRLRLEMLCPDACEAKYLSSPVRLPCTLNSIVSELRTFIRRVFDVAQNKVLLSR